MHLLLQDAWSAYVETPAPPKFRLQLMVFCVFFLCFSHFEGHAAQMAVETGINSTPSFDRRKRR